MHPATTMPHLAYRSDIDGLRALAVLLVISFHAFPEWLRGGFIGVDIFFVISGFLISTIIMQGLSDKNFSFVEFYCRRIRRIFPALAVVLVASLALGWFVLTANEYKALSKYAAGGAGFVANLFFLHDGGYFGGAATAKPLLHLWSLGVEEQFYIVWPIALWLAWKVGFSRWVLMLTAATLSFLWGAAPLLADSMAWEHYFQSPVLRLLARTDLLAIFYLPQARVWELLVGAALAMMKLRSTGIAAPRNAVAWAGVGLILLGLLLITPDSIFPGYWALLPTAGAALILAAGSQSRFNRVVLSSKPAVAIGLISYPLYLWHWPLLSFAAIIMGDTPPLWLRVACVVVAFILALVTYRYVEIPVRKGAHLRKKAMLLAVSMALIGGGGMYIYLQNGLAARSFATRTQFISDASSDWKFPGDLIKTSIPGIATTDGADIYVNIEKPPQILFLGDSHMQQYAPRLAQKATHKNIPILFLTGGGCPAIPGVSSKDHYHCTALIDHFQKILQQNPSIKTVVVGGCWNGIFMAENYRVGNGPEALLLRTDAGKARARDNLKRFLKGLSRTHRVYLVLDNPSMEALDPTTMLRHRWAFQGRDHVPQTVPASREQALLNEELSALGTLAGATIIDPLAHLCDAKSCRLFDRSGALIYQNATHLRAHFVTTEANYMDIVFSNPAGRP